jgi:hypothetical protein
MASSQTRQMIPADYRHDPELIPLNLIYDYPVRWSNFKVLRDLVQNFYDAVPNSEWENRFTYGIQGNTLSLKAFDVGFSYDWLIPIGASTKRENMGEYAGYFGEGFKIASLCAIRDYGWRVEMRSRDWSLKVVTSQLEVDGRGLKSLAYQIQKCKNPSPDTVLCIAPFNEEPLLQNVLLSFYYPDNPLFGDKIWASSRAAVYYRSRKPKPQYYPRTYNDNGQGIIFAGYQALGSFQYPLIFCLHDFRHDDRERSSFYRMDVVKVIKSVVTLLPPEASAKVLRVVKSRWYDQPRKKYDFESWHGIIGRLVRNVAASSRLKAAWRKEFPDLLVARQVKRSEISRYNRRRQALDWARLSGKRFRLVQEAFEEMGYPKLEDVCEQDGGFSRIRNPMDAETERIKIMEAFVSRLFPELLRENVLPPCKIIKGGRSTWQGMTECTPIKSRALILGGLTQRYQLPYVALKENLLDANEFGEALGTYLHELAHMFGGDRSASFSRALSEMMSVLLSNSRLISLYEKKWNDSGPANSRETR